MVPFIKLSLIRTLLSCMSLCWGIAAMDYVEEGYNDSEMTTLAVSYFLGFIGSIELFRHTLEIREAEYDIQKCVALGAIWPMASFYYMFWFLVSGILQLEGFFIKWCNKKVDTNGEGR